MNVSDLAASEETWFIRNACKRNNARILLAVAREFGLKIPTVPESYSFDESGIMASCTTETLHHDLVKQDKHNRYSLYNRTADTTRGQVIIFPCAFFLLFEIHLRLSRGTASSAPCTHPRGCGFSGDHSRRARLFRCTAELSAWDPPAVVSP